LKKYVAQFNGFWLPYLIKLNFFSFRFEIDQLQVSFKETETQMLKFI